MLFLIHFGVLHLADGQRKEGNKELYPSAFSLPSGNPLRLPRRADAELEAVSVDALGADDGDRVHVGADGERLCQFDQGQVPHIGLAVAVTY